MEENKKEGFRGDEYYGGVMLLEIPINLFELPKQFKLMFAEKISTFMGLTNEEFEYKANLIVVGPLNSDRKYNVVNQIVERHSRSDHFFIQGAVMLIIKPIAVENVDISGYFYDWKPEAIPLVIKRCPGRHTNIIVKNHGNWLGCTLLEGRSDWPKCKSVIDASGCVVDIKCGQSNCKFQLTAYQYHYQYHYRGTDDVFSDAHVQDDTT